MTCLSGMSMNKIANSCVIEQLNNHLFVPVLLFTNKINAHNSRDRPIQTINDTQIYAQWVKICSVKNVQ